MPLQPETAALGVMTHGPVVGRMPVPDQMQGPTGGGQRQQMVEHPRRGPDIAAAAGTGRTLAAATLLEPGAPTGARSYEGIAGRS